LSESSPSNNAIDGKIIADRDWYQGIKDIRKKRHVDIFTAEIEMLQNPKWRRWIILRVRSNRRCYKQAKHHVEAHGDKALFTLDERHLSFKKSL